MQSSGKNKKREPKNSKIRAKNNNSCKNPPTTILSVPNVKEKANLSDPPCSDTLSNSITKDLTQTSDESFGEEIADITEG